MDAQITQRLVNVYNSLLNIHTCGDETFLMADTMREFLSIIKNIAETQEG